MEVEAAGVEKERETNNIVMRQFTDPEGAPLGPSMYLPQSAGPKELQNMVNQIINNEEKLPCAFYVSNHELVVQLGSYLQSNKVSVEKVLTIVYQPQAIFRIRPVLQLLLVILRLLHYSHVNATRTGYFVLHGHPIVNILLVEVRLENFNVGIHGLDGIWKSTYRPQEMDNQDFMGAIASKCSMLSLCDCK
ncbi:unnamed protein product [Fraxinus pennsylvanica]|uniref:NLE domain-containing protein n=1 Tax=Fraxinus pennsylvanica TaxID=56036 RepID=A0AAD2EB51_9LAMI|nr:unnamed protein product [Fraxinus pennsylvanica]